MKEGHYIHEASEKHPTGTKVMRTVVRGEEQVWVEAEDFMVVQKERDDLRRALALINSLRLRFSLPAPAVTLLEEQGFDVEQARAMVGIIQQLMPVIYDDKGAHDLR